jgi:hypothetical protein
LQINSIGEQYLAVNCKGKYMSLGTEIANSFDRSFKLYDDLVEAIDENVLGFKLPKLASNTMGLQLWCVIGARESFSRAIEANEWSGFSCSLDATTSKEQVGDALRRSAESVAAVLKSIETYTDRQSRLILDLLEHEAAHHGQLIRYIYGLKLPIPATWKSKYALEEK